MQTSLNPTLPPANPPAPVIHFPGLNALRFYAALCVMVSHINDQFSSDPGVFSILQRFMLDAQSAVNLFFVLSGFLITYLLLKEKEKTQTIGVRKFYIRRALRIWPLYYVIVVIGFIIFPLAYGSTYQLHGTPTLNRALTFVLLPQFANLSPPLIHLWSVGIEEMFYMAWPWLLRRKNLLLHGIIGVLIVKFVVVLAVAGLELDYVKTILNILRFECMAVGALGAHIYFYKHPILRQMYHQISQIVAFGAIILIQILDIHIMMMKNILESYAFLIIILNVATNKRSLVKMEHPVLDYLGHISYGLYMYHFPIIYVVVRTLWLYQPIDAALYKLIIITSTLAGTIAVAALSYRWLEKPFLALKTRFAIIRSKG